MKPYDPAKIEPKWQKKWHSSKIYRAKENTKKKKFYGLIEFPYPSGEGLHVGHIRSNTAMDIISRKRRMEGFEVLYPIGWDAFGLPAENYAIKTGTQPSTITKKNAATFRRQLKALGFGFDWSREVDTTDPKYYKWTQWIFLQMLKNGLAYKKKMAINWCPKDLIGLANEEVVDGKCERCGTPVEKKEKEQWMLAITKYADRLDKDLDTVDFEERIKTQQRNWIGKSEGAEIDFSLDFKKNPADNGRLGPDGKPTRLKIFTTRPDTIYGATYLVLSPEHLWVTLALDDAHDVLENKDEVKSYLAEVKKKSEIERTAEGKEKTGVELKGIKAINPATKEEIPIYVADYVLAHYGTGAIMAVPAHDERDAEFAKKFGLAVKRVVEPLFLDTVDKNKPLIERDAIIAIIKHWSEDRYIGLKWKKVNWQTLLTGGPDEGQSLEQGAIKEILEETGYKHPKLIKQSYTVHSKFFHAPKNVNRFAHLNIFYFQLENGEKLEIADEEKENHEVVWLTPDEMGKFLTPECHRYVWNEYQNGEAQYTGLGILVNSGPFDGRQSDEVTKEITQSVGGKSVTTYKLRDWIFSRQRYWGEPIPVIHCEKCGIVPVPEKDLPVKLPPVKNYQPTQTGESPLASIKKWVSTKCPQCKGPAKRETDTMPNWAGSSWYYLRYTDPKNAKVFAGQKNLKYWTPVDWYNGGMEHTTLHLLYSRFWHKFLFDLGLVPTSEPYQKRTSHGLILAEGGVKMSKSVGNVINPDGIVKTFGADALRLYEMFMGPFEQHISWDTNGIVGTRRFIEKVWRLQEKVVHPFTSSEATARTLHKAIKKVTEDIESMGFNTAISTLMITVNELEKIEAISRESYGTLLKLIAPFAPHVTEELWALIVNKGSIHQATWPEFDPSLIINTEATIVVQVNGKTRTSFTAALNSSKEFLETKVQELPEIKKWIEGKSIVKIIVVPGRLVNIVINELTV